MRPMRILVLRPASEGQRVAQLLEARGHEVVFAPILEIRALAVEIPVTTDFDFVIATSANALLKLPKAIPASLFTLPIYVVGEQVAHVAREAGFTKVFAGGATASALSAHLLGGEASCTRGLYLAGIPRKPELETTLKAAGIRLTMCEIYRARPVDVLPKAAGLALRNGLDVILHFSRASAEAALDAFTRAELLVEAANARHLCLSGDVAAVFVDYLDWRIEIASEPSLAAMLERVESAG